MPFMTFVTRCYRRPNALERNCNSIKAQSDQDYEHLFIVDDLGRGLLWANQQFHIHRNEVQGEYVKPLDDDSELIDKDFIRTIKSLDSPDVVMFKIQVMNRIYPLPGAWEKYPRAGRISGGCICVKNHIYRKHIKAFGVPSAGDFYFIKEVFDVGYKIAWLDKIVSKSAMGRGRPEHGQQYKPQ